MRWLTAILLSAVGPLAGNAAEPVSWPQFRGVNAAGLAAGDQKYLAEIGPDQNALWKTPLPPGHSSPIIWGDRIFLTAVRDKQLLTLGLERATGKVVWQAEAPYQNLEKI